MMAPMALVWVVDIAGSSLLIIMSIHAVRLMAGFYRKNRDTGIYSYLYAQTIALAVFAVSRSAGHIAKHFLVAAGYADIWKAMAPVSGSVNSLTFVAFGIFALLYSNIRAASERVDALEKSRRRLKSSEKKYRTLVESSPDMIHLLDPDGRFLSVNLIESETLGYSPEEFSGMTITDVISPGHAADMAHCLEAIREKGGVTHETEMLARDGRRIPVEFNAAANYDAYGNFVSSLGIFRDITERRRAEGFIKDILECVDEEFIVVDPEYRIVSANRAFCENAGMHAGDVIGRHCHEVSHYSDRPCFEAGEACAVKRAFETGAPHTVRHSHHEEKRNPVYLEIKAYPMKDSSGNVISVIELINDVTEKKKIERHLRQAQRVEAIGTLTGGIAHDFNNILTSIMGFGEFLQGGMEKSDPLRAYVDLILASAERAANLTQALLAYSRKQVITPRPVNLNVIVRKVEELLSRLIGEDIELEILLAGQDITVMADGAQFEQVLLNLSTNARDAMPEGGTLTIMTEIAELDEEYVTARGYGRPGEYALLTVVDTGFGVDAADRERVFEPFFTTKEAGKGTGLGLSIVYGIVKQHDGYINFYSEPGEGTAIKIYLPLIQPHEPEEDPETPAPAGGTETVLVAEDDAGVRDVVRRVLTRAGYEVVEAVDGEDALRAFEKYGERVDLVLLDVIMPGINGKAVHDRIKSQRPGVKTLFMSGYSENIIHKKGIIEEGLNFIPKPVSPRELLRSVRETLDG